MHFESPYAFLLLLLIPVLLMARNRGRGGGTLRFPSTQAAARTGRSLRRRLAGLPPFLRALSLTFLTIALARPQRGLERVRDINKGIAIEMVVDRSGSMNAEMEYRGKRLNRLDVVKRVFEDFVLGNGAGLPGRPNDLIGLIAFARYPDTIAPLTLAHGALPRFLDTVKIVKRRSEDGTAIGDAIALAAARLKTAEETLTDIDPEAGDRYEIKSKVIILLTDGANNTGRRSPSGAAELARSWGIKIYTIGVGGGEAVTTIQTPLGSYKVPTGPGVDEATLSGIARATGGVYRRADSARALERVYREIDRLETTDIESVRYVDYREIFPPFALLSLLFLTADVLLSNTWLRRIP